MRRSTVIGLVVLLAAFAAGYASNRFGGDDSVEVDGPPEPGDVRLARVERVVDGDTVVLTGIGRARLIGVDTPEIHGGAECFGDRASSFTKDELDGEEVHYAVGRERRDRYGRLLVYLWVEGRSFNATLLAGGYARTLTIPPNDRYARRFAATAARARRAGAGLWSTCS